MPSKLSKAPRAPKPNNRLPRFKPLEWSDYSVGDIPSDISRATLERAVTRAAKAANQRLRSLEAKGQTKTAYAMAMRSMAAGRTRFRERTKSLSDAALRQEYVRLREFIQAPTSTSTGQQEIDFKRYQTATERGYTGSFDEWQEAVEKYFVEAKEHLLSSDVTYTAIINGNTSILDEIIAAYKANRAYAQTEGGQLNAYLQRTRYLRPTVSKGG